MIKLVESRILIDEVPTDGHSPMRFICSDGKMYYVKYRSGKSMKKEEINCLVYEMVCTTLLNKLSIPTPEHALVTVIEDSYVKGQLQANKKYTQPGIIALGSKEIERADLIKDIESLNKRSEFNKLLNPTDLVKIALFDLWVDNKDRHPGNYNLLTNMKDGKIQFVAIDHAFTFGGPQAFNIFNETFPVSSYNKLIKSQYFQSVVKFIEQKELFNIINSFLSLLPQLPINDLLDDIFKQVPKEWEISEALKGRIIAFLQSKQRLVSLKHVISQSFIHKKSRQ